MAVTTHPFPSFTLGALKKTLNASTDTLQVLLVASGTYTWNSTAQAHVTVHDVLVSGSGSGSLTEVSTSGTGYTRQALTSVSVADSGAVTTLTCANPSWSSATFSAVYAVFYDNSVGGTDSTNQVVGYWDFGSAQVATSTVFTININSSGLLTWTSS
jgi:hypothetical protein